MTRPTRDEARVRAAVVSGAAGMGKSRLAAELVRRIHERRPDVASWIGRGDSLRAGSTLDLLAQALRSALGVRGGEPLAERQEQIRARVAAHVPAAERKRVAAFLGERVATPLHGDGDDDGHGSAALRAARQDASLMSEQMRRAWLDFLGAVARGRHLLELEEVARGDGAMGLASSLRRFGLAWLLADQGALDEAHALASQLAESGHAQRDPVHESRGRWVLAEVLRRRGELANASERSRSRARWRCRSSSRESSPRSRSSG